MIAVVSPRGSSFKHLLRYLEFGRDGKQRGRAAWMEFHNLATRNPMLAACFMAATAAGSVSGTEKPVYHFSVSFDIDDPVDEATMRRVAERTRRDMGLLEYQCVVVGHQDRSHLHLHFVVNRVHPERGTLWRDWRDYHRLERSLRAQEVELGLRVVPGWNAPVPSLARDRDGLGAQPQNERRIKPSPGPRRGDEAFLRDMIVRAAPVLRADSWAEIERGMAEEGLTLRSKGGGFIVTDGKHWVKASQVGRGCSRYWLEKRLGRWPDYRARMAVSAMARPEPVVQLEPGVSRPEVFAPAVDSLPPTAQPDTSTPTISPVLEWNSQARLRSRKPQFGDPGHGIAELLGYPPARHETPVAPAADASPVTPPQPSVEVSIAGEISASHAELARQPHDQEEDAPLGEPTAPVEVIQPHAPVEAIQPAAPAEAIQPAAPAEAIQPTAAAGPYVLEEAHAPVSPEPPATPERVVQPAASPDIRAVETPKPKRFTLFEFYGTFGVEDRASGEIYFVETRDRAVAEVKFANQMAEHHPHSLSIDRLRALNDAWNDARGMPRRFDPKDYGTVPRVAGSVPGPIDDQPGAAPARSVGRPEGDAAPSPTEAAEPMQPGRPQPLPQPVVPGEPAVPVRKKVHPPTRREEYETALVNFTHGLKALYIDPHAARRAFAEEACVNGCEHALRTLAETPEKYGRLSFIAKRERLPEAVRWGGVYAAWQEERTRPATRRAAALYRQATQIEATNRLLRDAKDVADQKARELASMEEQLEGAEKAVAKVQERAQEVYVEPYLALKQIRACRKTKGLDEVIHTLRHAPERFGELRAEKQMFGSLRTPQTSAARTRAKTFANEVRAAYTALANRPDPGELERAREAHREVRHAVDAASRAQIRLPSTRPEDCVRQAGDVLRRAARGSIGRAERMTDQLATMGGAVKLARTALNLARGPERGQGHESGNSRRLPDWW